MMSGHDRTIEPDFRALAHDANNQLRIGLEDLDAAITNMATSIKNGDEITLKISGDELIRTRVSRRELERTAATGISRVIKPVIEPIK